MTLEIKLVLEFQQPTITCNLIYSSNTTTDIRIHHNEWVMIVEFGYGDANFTLEGGVAYSTVLCYHPYLVFVHFCSFTFLFLLRYLCTSPWLWEIPW